MSLPIEIFWDTRYESKQREPSLRWGSLLVIIRQYSSAVSSSQFTFLDTIEELRKWKRDSIVLMEGFLKRNQTS